MAKKLSKSDKITGAFDLFPKSAEAVKRNLNTFVVLWLLPLVFILLSIIFQRDRTRVDTATWSNPFSGLSGTSIAAIIGAIVIVSLVVAAIGILIQSMTFVLQLEAAKGNTPDLHHVFEDGKKYWLRLVGLFITVGFLVLIGLIAFIVPGVIFFRRYYLSSFALIDKDSTIKEAMKESARLSKPPYNITVWSILGVTVLLSLTGVIPVIGSLVSFFLTAFYSVAPAMRYRELKSVVK